MRHLKQHVAGWQFLEKRQVINRAQTNRNFLRSLRFLDTGSYLGASTIVAAPLT